MDWDVLPVLVSIRLMSSTYILPLFVKIYNRETIFLFHISFFNQLSFFDWFLKAMMEQNYKLHFIKPSAKPKKRLPRAKRTELSHPHEF